MRVLVTRPEPEATRTAQAIAALGHEAVTAPVLEIADLPAELPDGATSGAEPFAAIVVTSARALAPLARLPGADQLRGLPLLAVGDATRDAALDAGWPGAVSARGRMEDLARLVAARIPAGARLLYAAGEMRSGDLKGRLEAAGYRIELVELYASRAVADWEPDIVAMLASGATDTIQIYSRRSALAFLDLVRKNDLERTLRHRRVDVLSQDIADVLHAAGFSGARVAASPDPAGMLALLAPGPGAGTEPAGGR